MTLVPDSERSSSLCLASCEEREMEYTGKNADVAVGAALNSLPFRQGSAGSWGRVGGFTVRTRGFSPSSSRREESYTTQMRRTLFPAHRGEARPAEEDC
jgi:hypothetical protein